MTLKDRIEEVQAATGWNNSQLGAVAGVSRSAVAQWRGQTAKPVTTIKLAPALAIQEATGFSANWLAHGKGPKMAISHHPSEGFPPANAVAGGAANTFTATVEPSITWADLLKLNELPQELRTIAPDDALAPRLRAGQAVTLDPSIQPRSGDGVLISDKMGGRHLRIYRQGVGRWEAVSTNDSHLSFDSERDGLSVLAVITAVHARWA